MKDSYRLVFIAGLIGFTSWVLGSPTLARGQAVGNDGVYNSGGGVTFSPSFIDVSMLLPPNTTLGRDLCDAIYRLFSGLTGFPPYPAAGAVVDARGVSGATNLTCTHGTPWTEGSNTVTPPSTILLPATGGASATPIIISTPWIIPSNTHLIGEGDGIGSSAGTTIKVSGSFLTSPGYFFQMGSASGTSGISMERLTIDGGGLSINGILNQSAGRNSYVDHVSIYQFRGIGMLVEGTADGSGPYSNISFDTGTYSGTTSTACAQILTVTAVATGGSGGTQGIRGLSCHSENNDAPAAILLDSSNNSIEDVTIIGFYDGILVGSNAAAQSNVLINIVGDTTQGGSLTPVNAVHI